MTPAATRRALAGALVALLGARGAAADPDGLRNGDLAAWHDGAPQGWRVETAARSGAGPTSTVEAVAGGGLALAGDARTGTWRWVAQTVPVEVGGVYRLRFEARAEGLVREPGQFSSAYVGLAAREGDRVAMPTLRAEMAFRATWTPCEVLARATTPAMEVVAFLSMTGRLEVRALRFERVEPAGAFDALVDHVARTYPFFVERGVDWAGHVAPFRAQAAAVVDDPAAFAGVLATMLAGLRDAHVWIDRPGAARVATWNPPIASGFDAKATWARLDRPAQHGKTAISGRLPDDVGYVAIGALPAAGPEADRLLRAVEDAGTHAGLVVDLRPCGGGDEATAMRIAAYVEGAAPDAAPRVYARRRVRNGPGPTDFTPWRDATLAPATAGPARVGPVVAILGPACGSSGEGLAQMLEGCRGVTTLGRPTRGASGNPAPIPLPGGIDVWTSRWQDQRAGGEPLEGRGVTPQILVEATGPGDPALERALAVLRAKRADAGSPK